MRGSFVKNNKVPASFQGILWSKSINNLDLQKDKPYVIHQVLSCGSIKQIQWLLKVYELAEIKQVFLRFPKKVYTPSALNFVKNFILELKREKLPLKKYVKTAFWTFKQKSDRGA